MSKIYASIREDLYYAETLIPAVKVATQEQKYLDPILWQVCSVFDETGEVLLERPAIAGGGLYSFQSIDLDFETI